MTLTKSRRALERASPQKCISPCTQGKRGSCCYAYRQDTYRQGCVHIQAQVYIWAPTHAGRRLLHLQSLYQAHVTTPQPYHGLCCDQMLKGHWDIVQGQALVPNQPHTGRLKGHHLPLNPPPKQHGHKLCEHVSPLAPRCAVCDLDHHYQLCVAGKHGDGKCQAPITRPIDHQTIVQAVLCPTLHHSTRNNSCADTFDCELGITTHKPPKTTLTW